MPSVEEIAIQLTGAVPEGEEMAMARKVRDRLYLKGVAVTRPVGPNRKQRRSKK